jgi:hypothetical protein
MKTSYTSVYDYAIRNPFVLFAVVGFIVMTVVHASYTLSTQFTKTIAVDRTFTGVEGTAVSDSTLIQTTYNVVDRKGEVFEVVNSLWLWSWDKPMMWALFKPGKTYRVHGFGKYVGILSWYPSIVHVAEV